MRAADEAINFGTGRDISINEIAKHIVRLTGTKSKIVHIPKRLAEVHKLRCDASLAKKLFGWKPTVSVIEGLKRNIQWAKNHHKH